MFDDHEIINDYADIPSQRTLYHHAITPFEEYQQSVNPPSSFERGVKYTSLTIGKIAFFILDNRTYRAAQPYRYGKNSTSGEGERTMLGERQLREVEEWIEREGRDQGRLLVLVSGVPFTRNWSEGKDEFDSWAVSLITVLGTGKNGDLQIRGIWKNGNGYWRSCGPLVEP